MTDLGLTYIQSVFVSGLGVGLLLSAFIFAISKD